MNSTMVSKPQTGLFDSPSLEMQQMALAGSVLLGSLAAWRGLVWATACLPGEIHFGGVAIFLLGISTVIMALYAGWKTRWLTRTTSETLSLAAGRIALFFALLIGVLIAVAIFIAAVAVKTTAEVCGN